jgi:ABC-2 type transport system permease protein
MTTLAIDRRTIRDPGRTTAPVLPMLLAQTRAQMRAFWRMPSISATALLMPLMLFVFFVLPYARAPWHGSITVGAYMLAGIGAYAAGSVMVFDFGVTVAIDRGQRVDLLMRAAPLPGPVFLAARIAAALVFSVVAVAALFAVALVAGGIDLPVATWLDLGARLLVGAVPFLALGFAIAYLTSASAAPAVANLVYIGMAFASGMLVRLDQMPDFLRSIAPILPTYHFAQFAWGALGAADESGVVAGGWLLVYAVGLFAVAAVAYRRESRRRFA